MSAAEWYRPVDGLTMPAAHSHGKTIQIFWLSISLSNTSRLRILLACPFLICSVSANSATMEICVPQYWRRSSLSASVISRPFATTSSTIRTWLNSPSGSMLPVCRTRLFSSSANGSAPVVRDRCITPKEGTRKACAMTTDRGSPPRAIPIVRSMPRSTSWPTRRSHARPKLGQSRYSIRWLGCFDLATSNLQVPVPDCHGSGTEWGFIGSLNSIFIASPDHCIHRHMPRFRPDLGPGATNCWLS